MIKKKSAPSTKLPENIDQYLRQQLYNDIDCTETFDLGEAIYLPQWKLSIRPHLDGFHGECVAVYHYLQCPAWDRSLFECSIGIRESRKDSLDTAQKSFELCMFTGIRAMNEGLVQETVETVFAKHMHRWDVSLSNLVIMGDTPTNIDHNHDGLWTLLKTSILARLGNQKLAYVKIYGAKCNGDITAEVRFNDVPSAEMSRLLHDEVEKWDNEGFSSCKQFIFLRQHEDTLLPYPYREEQIIERTKEAVRLFAKYVNDPSLDFEAYHDELVTLCEGDKSLAEELRVYMPEFCAEHAFDKPSYPETLHLKWEDDGREVTCYQAQMASYNAIGKGLAQAWDEDYFTDEVYQALVSMSAIYNVISKAREEGTDLNQEECSVSLCYNVTPDFEMR